jgi:hypothetical protein
MSRMDSVVRGTGTPRDEVNKRDAFYSGTKKAVMPKKKVFVARNLKDCLPSLPLKTRKAKKKIKVFLNKIYVLPSNIITLLSYSTSELISGHQASKMDL